MSEPFVGEIRMFAGNFAPRGWAFCDGQLLAVSQNDALFSLLGTIYGGDGRTTFGLPEMRGRIPIHAGSGPGLTPRQLGHRGGAENTTLAVPNLPVHNHGSVKALNAVADKTDQAGRMVGTSSLFDFYQNGTPTTDGTSDMGSSSVTSTGGGQSTTNLMPTLCIHFIIALVGIYPSRH